MSRVWTYEENAYIVENAGKMTDEMLAKVLTEKIGRDITPAALRKQRQRLHVAKISGRGRCGLVGDDNWLKVIHQVSQYQNEFEILDNSWVPKKEDENGITTKLWFHYKHNANALYGIGLKFPYCEVVDYVGVGRRVSHTILWKCKCTNKHNGDICGNFFNAGLWELKHGTTKSCGCYAIQQSGLRARNITPMNHDYFNKDTLNCEKAHTMGFIAADGTLLYVNNGTTQYSNGSWRCRIKIADYDRNTLEVFKKRFEFEGNIVLVKRAGGKRNNQVELTLSSTNICNALQQNGIHRCKGRSTTPRLTDPYMITKDVGEIEPPPFTERELVLGYISGYYEGDGSLVWDNLGQAWKVKFSGHRTTLEWIAQELYRLNVVRKINKVHKSSKDVASNNCCLIYGYQSDVTSFINTMVQLNMHGRSILTMDRKWFPQSYRDHRNKKQRFSVAIVNNEERFYCFDKKIANIAA